jgi:hypothetical protein
MSSKRVSVVDVYAQIDRPRGSDTRYALAASGVADESERDVTEPHADLADEHQDVIRHSEPNAARATGSDMRWNYELNAHPEQKAFKRGAAVMRSIGPQSRREWRTPRTASVRERCQIAGSSTCDEPTR